jgi:hypothetical protein
MKVTEEMATRAALAHNAGRPTSTCITIGEAERIVEAALSSYDGMERIPIDKLSYHFGVSLEKALAAQADIGYMYRELASGNAVRPTRGVEILAARLADDSTRPMHPFHFEEDGANLFHPGITTREYLAAHAPVDLACAVTSYGASFPQDDKGRAAFFAVWSMLRYEYADAMLSEGKNP